jgi:hypothetical protein
MNKTYWNALIWTGVYLPKRIKQDSTIQVCLCRHIVVHSKIPGITFCSMQALQAYGSWCIIPIVVQAQTPSSMRMSSLTSPPVTSNDNAPNLGKAKKRGFCLQVRSNMLPRVS